MKNSIKSLLATFLMPLALSASVNLTFNGASLFGPDESTPLADGRLVIAVTTPNESFSGPIDGAFVSGDDILIGSWNIDSVVVGAPGAFDANFPEIELTGGIATGQKIAIFWFNDISSIENNPVVGSQYGYYSDSTWLVPSDGSAETFSVETVSVGGPVSDNLTVANLTVSAVPEPATYAVLLGVASIGFCFRRKRRKVRA